MPQYCQWPTVQNAYKQLPTPPYRMMKEKCETALECQLKYCRECKRPSDPPRGLIYGWMGFFDIASFGNYVVCYGLWNMAMAQSR